MKQVLRYLLTMLAGAWICGRAPADVIVAQPPVLRYVLVDNDTDAKAVSFLLNLVSTNSQIVCPVLEGNLVRIDLSHYAARGPKDLQRLVDAWEELRFDPAFNRLKIVNDVVVAETLHPPELCERLGTKAPVVECGYFITRFSTTIQDQFGNATIFGGLYYRAADIKETEAEQIKALGIDPGDDLLAYFNKLPSQLRAAMEKSGVSGKTRRIDWLATAARFAAIYVATRDVADGKQDGRSDFLVSLARAVIVAVESIFTRFNGLPGYALYNAEGKLQTEAPIAVVGADQYRDKHGRRNPHSLRLQMPLCLDCHMKGDQRGLLDFTNDVLEQSRRGIKPLDPLIAELYKGDPNLEGSELHQVVRRSREDLVKAVIATSAIGKQPGWPGGKGDQLDAPSLASAYLIQRYRAYVYEPLDARDALRELRVPNVPAELGDAAGLFNKVVPAWHGEPLYISRLRAGLEVDRFKWSLVRAEAFVRRRLPPDKGAVP